MEKLLDGKMKPEEVAILRRISHDPLQYAHGDLDGILEGKIRNTTEPDRS